MKKITIALISAGFVILVAGLFFGYKLYRSKIHYHAAFQVYQNNQLVDFSDIKYMKMDPCRNHESVGSIETKEDEQMEKAHLHNNVGDVVHVHRSGVLWKDLFVNLNYSFATTTTGYLNGLRVDNIFEQPIEPYGVAVILVGENEPQEALAHQVSIERIAEVEKQIENCGT